MARVNPRVPKGQSIPQPMGVVTCDHGYGYRYGFCWAPIIAEEGDPLLVSKWTRTREKGDPLLLGLLKRRERGGIPVFWCRKLKWTRTRGREGIPLLLASEMDTNEGEGA